MSCFMVSFVPDRFLITRKYHYFWSFEDALDFAYSLSSLPDVCDIVVKELV